MFNSLLPVQQEQLQLGTIQDKLIIVVGQEFSTFK